MNIREIERKNRIEVVKKSIEKSKDPDYGKLVLMLMGEYGVSRRTALEYIETAKYMLKI